MAHVDFSPTVVRRTSVRVIISQLCTAEDGDQSQIRSKKSTGVHAGRFGSLLAFHPFRLVCGRLLAGAMQSDTRPAASLAQIMAKPDEHVLTFVF